MSSKDSFWFRHDSNARNDIKIISLRMRCGWEGYGVFFAMIECLREERHNRIRESEIDALLNIMQIERHIFDSIVEVGLLKIATGYVFSESLDARMKEWNKLTKKRREAGKVGGSKPRAKANAKQVLSKRQANAKQMLSDMTGSELTGSDEIGVDSSFPVVAEATPAAVATKVRKPATTDIQRLWETYEAAILKRHGIKVTFDSAKTAAMLKRILKDRTLEESQRIAETYVSLDEPFVADQYHPISLLSSKMNLILAKMKQPKPLEPDVLDFSKMVGGDPRLRPRPGSIEEVKNG